jgi:hypothetical protein
MSVVSKKPRLTQLPMFYIKASDQSCFNSHVKYRIPGIDNNVLKMIWNMLEQCDKEVFMFACHQSWFRNKEVRRAYNHTLPPFTKASFQKTIDTGNLKLFKWLVVYVLDTQRKCDIMYETLYYMVIPTSFNNFYKKYKQIKNFQA